MTGAERRIILKALFDKTHALSGIGYVLPSPHKFIDTAEFWALLEPKLTQKAIETTPIAYVMISRVRFEDENPIEEGCADNPLTFYDYNFRVFRQFFPNRFNESDSFLKRINDSYESFLDAIDALKGAFLGEQIITGLPNGWTVESNSLTQSDFNQDLTESEEVSGVTGFYADLQCRISVLIND